MCAALTLALSPAALALPATSHGSGIVGGVYSWPSCGVPFPDPCTDGNVANDPVRVWRLSDHRIVARAKTNTHGRFRIRLPPGAYRFEARTNFPNGPFSSWVTRGVTVRRDHFTKVILVYDNHIR
ncbi:MAG: carboxypeptidase-like regulatory domain-containing protein [Solirubrobacteraceae bacterium]|nr:MAG: hypothetical protein DLM63_03670 [Solirubrobacterales bacterium]